MLLPQGLQTHVGLHSHQWGWGLAVPSGRCMPWEGHLSAELEGVVAKAVTQLRTLSPWRSAFLPRPALEAAPPWAWQARPGRGLYGERVLCVLRTDTAGHDVLFSFWEFFKKLLFIYF